MNISKEQKFGLTIVIAAIFLLLILLVSPSGGLKGAESNVLIKQEVKARIKGQNELQSDKAKKELISYDFILANKILSDFFINLNCKDYDKAYDMFDVDYTGDFDISLDIFKSRYDYKEEKLFTIKGIEKYEDRYIVNVIIESLDKEKKAIIKKVFTLVKKDKEYLLADIGIKDVSVVDERKVINGGIGITLQKIYSTDNGVVAIINFENKTSSCLNIKSNSFGFYAKNENNLYAHNLIEYGIGDYQVVPGIPRKYKVSFEQIEGLYTIGYTDMGTSESFDESIEGKQTDLFDIK